MSNINLFNKNKDKTLHEEGNLNKPILLKEEPSNINDEGPKDESLNNNDNPYYNSDNSYGDMPDGDFPNGNPSYDDSYGDSHADGEDMGSLGSSEGTTLPGGESENIPEVTKPKEDVNTSLGDDNLKEEGSLGGASITSKPEESVTNDGEERPGDLGSSEGTHLQGGGDEESLKPNKDVNTNIGNKPLDDNNSSPEKLAASVSFSCEVLYTLDVSSNNSLNELILDSLGNEYSYDPDTTYINGEKVKINLNVEGSFTSLRAQGVQKTFKTKFKESEEYIDTSLSLGIDTSYGFKLSDVMDHIGDLSQIKSDVFPVSENEGIIELSEESYLVRGKNGNKVILNFYFKNVGNESARRVTFKNILPSYLNLNFGGIFINSCYASPDNVIIEGRKIIVKIPDINKRSISILTLICDVGNVKEEEENISCVFYVSRFSSKGDTDELSHGNSLGKASSLEYSLNIRQTLSEKKRARK